MYGISGRENREVPWSPDGLIAGRVVRGTLRRNARDARSWESYGRDLEANLQGLLDRVHRGGYRARPARRTYIPKADGSLRPLGIAALEDKLLQRGVVEVFNGIYEADFLGFSYGFRPGHSAHDALDALAAGIYDRTVNWVLDADIRDFFGSLDRGWLMKFLEQRVNDRRVLRLSTWVNLVLRIPLERIKNGEQDRRDEVIHRLAQGVPGLTGREAVHAIGRIARWLLFRASIVSALKGCSARATT